MSFRARICQPMLLLATLIHCSSWLSGESVGTRGRQSDASNGILGLQICLKGWGEVVTSSQRFGDSVCGRSLFLLARK